MLKLYQGQSLAENKIIKSETMPLIIDDHENGCFSQKVVDHEYFV